MMHFLATAVEDLYVSAHLADVGCGHEDPILLLAAARLVANASPSLQSMAPEIAGGEPDVKGTRGRICVPYGPPVTEHTSDSLLADARALAKNDQHMLSVIDAARAKNNETIERYRNGTAPDAYKLRLARGAKATFRIEFRVRETAVVAIVGTSGAHLDLTIRDDKNAAVCDSDVAWTEYRLCKWHPTSTATFSIVIENRGDWANNVTLYTN